MVMLAVCVVAFAALPIILVSYFGRIGVLFGMLGVWLLPIVPPVFSLAQEEGHIEEMGLVRPWFFLGWMLGLFYSLSIYGLRALVLKLTRRFSVNGSAQDRLIPCPLCGSQTRESGTSCLTCGRPYPRKDDRELSLDRIAGFLIWLFLGLAAMTILLLLMMSRKY